MTQSLFIVKSETRKAILAFLFAHGGREFYLRDLARKLEFPAGNVRRELLKLIEEGIVEARREANLRYFKLNPGHPLFEELKSIVEKTVGIPARLKDILGKIPGIRIAWIYGSLAKGSENGASDIDVVVVGTLKPADENRLDRCLADLEKKFRREINHTVYRLNEFRRKAKDASNYLSEVVKQKKVFLIGDERRLKHIIQAMA